MNYKHILAVEKEIDNVQFETICGIATVVGNDDIPQDDIIEILHMLKLSYGKVIAYIDEKLNELSQT